MSGGAPPSKPWERNRTIAGASTVTAASSVPAALATSSSQHPLSSPSTSDLTSARPVPARPWEQSNLTAHNNSSPYSTPYSGPASYGPSTSYGASPYSSVSSPYGGVGSSMYSSPYNRGAMMGGGMVGGGMMGSSMLGSYGAQGSSMYGRPAYGGGYSSSMYGGSTYGAGYGAGGYGNPMYGGASYGPGGGMMGAPQMDPNNPMPTPPTGWQHFLAAVNGLMSFVGRLSFLVDENTHAMHFFISALLQLLDRAGSLYGELARFVLRLLGRRRKAGKRSTGDLHGHDAPGKQLALVNPQQQQVQQHQQQQLFSTGRTPSVVSLPQAGAGQWDSLWQR